MGKRIGLLDEIRGITYIAMIIYHAYYDIVFVYGHDLPDVLDAVMRFIQPLIAGTFIVIAGISSNFSSNNFVFAPLPIQLDAKTSSTASNSSLPKLG